MTKSERARPVDANGDTPVTAEQVFVDDEKVQVTFLLKGGMSTGATDRFRDCLRNYGSSLIREVYRLEETERVPGEHAVEITTSMVVKADQAVRNSTSSDRAPLSNFALLSPIAGSIFALVAGIFGSYLHSWWQWLLCGLFGLLALAFLTLGNFELRRRP